MLSVKWACHAVSTDSDDAPGARASRSIALTVRCMSSRLSDVCMQVKDEGYEVEHNGYCVTVFSAPNYCDQMNNKGAWIRFSGKDMTPQFTQFEAVPHPNVRAMAYAGNFYSSMLGM